MFQNKYYYSYQVVYSRYDIISGIIFQKSDYKMCWFCCCNQHSPMCNMERYAKINAIDVKYLSRIYFCDGLSKQFAR